MLRGIGLILVTIVSVPALSCPKLAGKYTCIAEDGKTEALEISQGQKQGVIQFLINGSELVADNVPYAIEGDATFLNASIRTWCDDSTLRTELVGQYYQADTSIGDLSLVTEVTVKDNIITETASGRMKNEKGEYPVSGISTCTRD